MIAAQFDPRGFAVQLGMSRDHFAIKHERNIGVKLFLKLMQTLVRTIPRPCLVHGENDFAGFFIDPKQIDDRRIGDPSLRDFLLMLLILRHWAE